MQDSDRPNHGKIKTKKNKLVLSIHFLQVVGGRSRDNNPCVSPQEDTDRETQTDKGPAGGCWVQIGRQRKHSRGQEGKEGAMKKYRHNQ